MTFQEMFDAAKRLGYSVPEMRENCKSQLEQYRQLTRESGDKWDKAAQGCENMLRWLP